MNLMPAEALGNSSFRVSGQIVSVPNLENKSGRLGVRPEVIDLKPLEPGQNASIQAVIELVTYLGADQQVILKVGSDTWVARVENDQVFARGQKVSLEIPSNAWLWLPN
jgi:putative spermidine/putrescine transport system ATP-binding protein